MDSNNLTNDNLTKDSNNNIDENDINKKDINKKDISKNKVFELDFSSMTPREANQKIKGLSTKCNKILIKNPNAMHYLVAGLTENAYIEVDVSAG